MDVLSSQSNLAGYRAVIDYVAEFEKLAYDDYPGTVPAAKVLVVGAGVAGLQAMATAKGWSNCFYNGCQSRIKRTSRKLRWKIFNS